MAVALAISALQLCVSAAAAQVVISQVWGGGGVAGTGPNSDFVELFNSGPGAQSLAGWSVQAAASTATTNWSVAPLPSFNLLPGQYFLVRLDGPSATGQPLPTPDAVASPAITGLVSTGGRVALCSSTTPLPGTRDCVNGHPTIVDLVGFGTSATWREAAAGSCPGTTASNAPPGTTAIPVRWVARRNNGCTDTNFNSSDFVQASIPPRNSLAFNNGAHVGVTIAPTAGRATVPMLVTVTATVVDCASLLLPGGIVTADLSAIGGATAVELRDDGVAPDAVAGNGVYTAAVTVTPVVVGQRFPTVSATAGMGTGVGFALFTVDLPPPSNDIACTAEVIGPLPYNGFSVLASQAAADPDFPCNSNTSAAAGLWWRYDAAADGALLVRETSSNDTAMAVYTGPNCSSLTLVQCLDDTTAGPSDESMGFNVFAGNSYWVLVSLNSAASTQTPYAVNFSSLAPVPNDSICSALTIPAAGFSGLIDARAAWFDPDISCNVAAAPHARHGLWFPYATGPRPVTLVFTETSSADVVYAVYTGSTCADAAEVVSLCTGAESVTYTLNPQTNYWFLVALDSVNDGPTAAQPFALSIIEPPGACCVGGDCQVLGPNACALAGGEFFGGPCTDRNGENPADAPMPDYPPAGPPSVVESTLTITNASGPVTSLSISVDLTHPWLGDLRIELVAPDGTAADLLGRAAMTPCPPDGAVGLGNDVNGIYTFDDAAVQSVRAFALGNASQPLPSGPYRAAGCDGVPITLSGLSGAFSGSSADGLWTLRLTDRDEGLSGLLRGWSLTLNGGVDLVSCAGDDCPLDLSGNAIVDADDIFTFLALWFDAPPGGPCPGASPCTADFNSNGLVDADDIFAYLTAWFAFGPGTPCP